MGERRTAYALKALAAILAAGCCFWLAALLGAFSDIFWRNADAISRANGALVGVIGLGAFGFGVVCAANFVVALIDMAPSKLKDSLAPPHKEADGK